MSHTLISGNGNIYNGEFRILLKWFVQSSPLVNRVSPRKIKQVPKKFKTLQNKIQSNIEVDDREREKKYLIHDFIP